MDFNISYRNATNMTLQDVEWHEFAESMIPFAVVLSILSAVGTFGNVMVILTTQRWDKQSNYRILILSLAYVDFLSCFLGIPGFVVFERFQYTMQSDISCKMSTLFYFFVGICSLHLLSFTAVERYRKTCRPFGSQFSLKQTKIICSAFNIYSLVLAAPSALIFSSKTVITDYGQLIGHSCLLDNEKKFSEIYHIVFIFCLFMCILTCTLLYCIVGRTILLQKKRRPKQVQFRYRSDTATSVTSSPGSCQESDVIDSQGTVTTDADTGKSPSKSPKKLEISVVKVSSTNRNAHEKYLANTSVKRKSIYDKSAQISLMFLVSSFLSCSSYVPLFVFRGIQTYNFSLFKQIFDMLGPLANILHRLHVVNHVINPIVYFFINSKFRKDCKLILLRCVLCCRHIEWKPNNSQ